MNNEIKKDCKFSGMSCKGYAETQNEYEIDMCFHCLAEFKLSKLKAPDAIAWRKLQQGEL